MPEPSEIDEEELNRQMELELARIAQAGDDGEDFEKSSSYSIFNQSLSNFNP